MCTYVGYRANLHCKLGKEGHEACVYDRFVVGLIDKFDWTLVMMY